MLAAVARRRSDGVLATWAGAGCLVAVATAIVLPRWLVVFLLALGAAAFGFWGILDRELAEALDRRDERIGRVRVLRLLRAVIAIVGTAAGTAALLATFGVALGTWIS